MDYRTINFSLSNIPDELRFKWEAWLDRHYVDPDDVIASDGWIKRDTENNQVRYLGLMREFDGKPAIDLMKKEYIREIKVIQLDFEPEPFPKEGP